MRGHFVRSVGLPLEAGLHEKTGFLHPPLDSWTLEEEEIQGDGLAQPLIEVAPLLAHVEREQQEAARTQDAVELGEGAPLCWLLCSSAVVFGSDEQSSQHSTYDVGLFARLLAPNLLLAFGAGAVLSFIQLYFVTGFGLSAGALGVFLAVAGTVGALGSLVSPALTGRLGPARAAILLQSSAVPLIAALALAPSLVVAVLVYVVWSLVRSASDPTYTGFAMSRVQEGQRSTLSGFYSVTWALGFSSGPIATGWLRGATHGYTVPFLVAAGSYAVATLTLYTFFGTGRGAAATVDAAAEAVAAR